MPSNPAPDELRTCTLKAVTWRLLPFMMLLYFIAYLDRVNVGFAALTMNADLGLSATVYGLGAGVFFVGYVLFEVPSNVLLHKLGARIWIARIMLTWGLLSGAMAFITGPTSFYIVRFLLGVAEAGFFPGMILYLTYWFPASTRVKVTGLFMVAIPLSATIGAPISSALLGLDWLGGMKGWQWMFILEAAPAIILGFVVFFYLTDRPERAEWLTAEQRGWLAAEMEAERRAIAAQATPHTLGHALRDPRVIGFGLVYFSIVMGSYALGFWLPQIVKGFGAMSNMEVGLITSAVNAFGTVAMIYWAYRSDKRQERLGHFMAAALLSAVAFGAFTYVQATPILAVVALTFAAMGIFGALPVFWAQPTSFLSGVGAAGGIALINSIGNAAGYFGPFAIGYLKDATGSFSTGLLGIAALLVTSALLAATLVRRSTTRDLAASTKQASTSA
ncbi:MFS transporter [Tardiphaga sp. OK245]|uniref:MFS transporter n=1 Tax=Tardiphaga sp. OK245 TaxID=1855306 RepID=UPI0008A7C2CA|nr:MFS transporter [Tardiphaga sp. OK245]SEH88267.1 MFS transporter, ACS family, tartrate transporter [Tardiphaga sp. OK245]